MSKRWLLWFALDDVHPGRLDPLNALQVRWWCSERYDEARALEEHRLETIAWIRHLFAVQGVTAPDKRA